MILQGMLAKSILGFLMAQSVVQALPQGSGVEPRSGKYPLVHLFNKGGPTCKDIKQHTDEAGWVAATMCAMVKCSPDFILRLYEGKQAPGEDGPIEAFRIYDEHTLVPTLQTVNYADSTSAKNDNKKKSIWWPSAIEQAIKQHGSSYVRNGEILLGPPYVALQLLSGIKASYTNATDMPWDTLVQKADVTPIIINTVFSTTKLERLHYYAVLTARVDDSKNKIKLFSQTGSVSEHVWEEIELDVEAYHHFENWDAYVGQA